MTLLNWTKHFYKSVKKETGYLVIGSLIGLYLTAYYLVEAKYNRDSSLASTTLSNFYSLANFGHPMGFKTAMAQFRTTYQIESIKEPKIVNPFSWFSVYKPNYTPLRDWTLFAFESCTKEICGSELYRIDLSKVPLNEAIFTNVNFDKTNFSSSYLDNIKIYASTAKNSNFSNIQGQFANFSKTNLESSKFDNAMLAGANFTGANLQNSTMDNILAYGVIFDDANLKGVSFLGADLEASSFKNAIYDESTIFPNGFAPSLKSK